MIMVFLWLMCGFYLICLWCTCLMALYFVYTFLTKWHERHISTQVSLFAWLFAFSPYFVLNWQVRIPRNEAWNRLFSQDHGMSLHVRGHGSCFLFHSLKTLYSTYVSFQCTGCVPSLRFLTFEFVLAYMSLDFCYLWIFLLKWLLIGRTILFY